jgi:hypothetical protein
MARVLEHVTFKPHAVIGRESAGAEPDFRSACRPRGKLGVNGAHVGEDRPTGRRIRPDESEACA